MKKLTLQLDDLRIESFSTTGAPRERGTVVGEEQCTCPTACSCPGCPTCDASCNGTCGGTCDASCYGTCGDTCAGCTWDASCGNNSCDYTCAGFQTFGGREMNCVIC
ncbi:hypothetical protein [Longimicrobium terrae]|uniref:Uncharacterized protein n=1 Tax=Longimicrobium terrae TaxID=1639882 RepID=A0A841H2K9_9BACT|nr:hypothetical protein [Longimicrobium terrae]MBB4637878.1 hypothetical protein [Longimicrobium terrae]MBB6072267.1 hypothetical protein [Longimicrobium terrae]NNC31189.1 hypothetical protein [Longimicrobium terrae]